MLLPRQRAPIATRCGSRRAALIVLCALLFGAPTAHALELGPLSVHSTLGERLRAELELVSIDEGELDGLRASLADIATYERFGVPRPDVLSSVAISLDTSEDGTPVVRIGSAEPVHELFLNVLLRIEDRDIHLVREVAILLDPSVTHSRRTDRGGDAPDAFPAGDAYTVRTGDSLMRIAERFAPPATSAEQTAVALHEANPEAFLGSIHRLIVGARLTLPTPEAVRSHSPRAARAIIRTGIEDFKRRLATPTSGAAGTTVRAGEPGAPAGARRPDAAMPLPLEDDIALQDFQAVIVNLKGSLYELQGTLDERIERLDGLHAQVDDLIEERVRIRESAERHAAAMAAEAEMRERLADAARATPAPTGTIAPESAAAATPAPETATPVDDDGLRPEAEAEPGRADVPREGEDTSSARASEDANLPLDEAPAAPSRATGAGEPAAAEERDVPTREGDPVPASRDIPTNDAATEIPSITAENGTTAVTRAARPDDAGAPPGAERIEPAGEPSRTDPSGRAGDITAPARRFASRWSLAQSMQALRDGGLVVLALCMIHVLFSRRFRRGDETDGMAFDPDAALDFYLHQSVDESMKAEWLASVLADSPGRQDIRLRLLELHARQGSMSRFAIEAQAMYRMTRGDTPEWPRVVEMGLELDADIDFYRMVIDDDPFDLELNLGLSDEERVSSVPGGTHSGREEGAGSIVSFEEFAALRNSVPRSDEGELFSTTPELDFDADGSDWRSDDEADRVETRVPLAERPVYVPEDASELITIAVNYTYGVDKLDLDLAGDDADDADERDEVRVASPRTAAYVPGGTPLVTGPEDAFPVELSLDAVVERPVEPAGESPFELFVAPPLESFVDASVEPPVGPADVGLVRHDDFAAEFVDFDIPVDADTGLDDDLMVDLAFRTDSVDVTLRLAETYVDNGCGEEARHLIDGIRSRADIDQERRAVELLDRIAERRAS